MVYFYDSSIEVYKIKYRRNNIKSSILPLSTINSGMNSVDSLSLSRKMNIPFKFLQKLSLSQTDAIEKFSKTIPLSFQQTILSSSSLADALIAEGISINDREYPCTKLLFALKRKNIVDGKMTGIEERELITALAR